MTVDELRMELARMAGDAEIIFSSEDYVSGWPDWSEAMVVKERDADDEPTGRVVIRLMDIDPE